MSKYSEYLEAVSASWTLHPSWRLGQTYFNVLYDMRPVLADQIRTTDLDPFYRNERLPAFCKWVASKLDK